MMGTWVWTLSTHALSWTQQHAAVTPVLQGWRQVDHRDHWPASQENQLQAQGKSTSNCKVRVLEGDLSRVGLWPPHMHLCTHMNTPSECLQRIKNYIQSPSCPAEDSAWESKHRWPDWEEHKSHGHKWWRPNSCEEMPRLWRDFSEYFLTENLAGCV